MADGRYDITLDDVPAQIVEIAQVGVPIGYINRRTDPGYMLANGTALLESEKDEAGFYVGGAGMDGMYLRTPARYEPVRDEGGAVIAFRRMNEYLTYFTGEEQQTIFQYAMNTPEHLIEDLTAALPQLKKAPQVYALFDSTAKKLRQIPPDQCRRLMADIRAAYKGRHEQTIRERQQAAEKSAKKKRRSFER